MYRHYYANTQIIIYVVDSKDRDRIDEARNEITKIMNEEELRDCLLLVIANKQDLPNCLTVDEVREKLEIDKLTHIKYKTVIGTCATNGDNLYECLEWIQLNYKLQNAMSPIVETVEDMKNVAFNKGNSYFKYFIDQTYKAFNILKSIN